MEVKSYLKKHHGDATLLGICPMAEEIVRAAILEARETGYIPMFIATPRQIDADRGYTGWSQNTFVQFVKDTANQLGYEGNYVIARDHGGPYQSFRDRDRPEVSTSTAMKYAMELFSDDLRAGFDVIHVDATEDPTIAGSLELSEVAERTAQLILRIEELRVKEGLDSVSYEVGTEEIVGGMTDPSSFQSFLDLLVGEIGGQVTTEKLVFVVGQVGTTMRVDMTNRFNREQAEKLTAITSGYGLFLKVHYTDWLSDSVLSDFPDVGIGAANVGPEFAAALLRGLIDLEQREKQALTEINGEGQRSNYFQTLQELAVERAPWTKFVPEEVEQNELESYALENQEDIALCVGRYVMNEPEATSAQRQLYKNIQEYTTIEDIDAFVIDKIAQSIRRYIESFNLGNNASS